eukprot:symbB.v1.2.030036.t1/scaffold3343.1/size61083/5
MELANKGAPSTASASIMHIIRKAHLSAYVLLCLRSAVSVSLSEDAIPPDSCEVGSALSVSLLQKASTMTSAKLLHPITLPEGQPHVLESRGYDEGALLEMGGYMSSCFSADYNEWTSCIAKKCHAKWQGNYHVVVGVPTAWGASIRDLDSAYLHWGGYDAWIWSS